jgi:hypothetical protein
MNAFLLLIRTVIYIIIKSAFFLIIATISIFWFDGLSKFKALLSLAFDIKDWFKDHIGFSIPVFKGRLRPGSYTKFIKKLLAEISGFPIDYNKVKESNVIETEKILVRKIDNIENLFLENSNKDITSGPINDILVNNHISMMEFSSNFILDFLARILSHSFIEFNLFI